MSNGSTLLSAQRMSSYEFEHVARSQAAACSLAAAQLEDGAGVAALAILPWAQPGDHVEDAQVGVQEDDVDREAHEPRIDGRGRTQEEAVPVPRDIRPRRVAPTPANGSDDEQGRASRGCRAELW